jgi:hypothetical protein
MTVVLGSSLPSLPTTVVDTATIENFKAEFVYNYFTPDELTSATSVIQSGVADPNTPEFSKNVPRYVRLTWNKINIQSTETVQEEFVKTQIEENAADVIDENLFGLNYFGVYSQQENGFIQRIQGYLNSLWNQLGLNPTNQSIPDVIRAINQSTPTEIDQDFLSRYLNYSTSTNLITQTLSTGNQIAERLENIVTNANVTNRAFGNLFYDKVLNDSLMRINESSINNVVQLFDKQASAERDNNRINSSMYDVVVPTPISTKTVDNIPYFGTVYQHTGYIIKRYQIVQGLELSDVTYYVEDPNTFEFFDTQIVYNVTYKYEIAPIILAQSMGNDIERSLSSITTYLVSCTPTTTIVQSLDETPPEPPTDFFIRWDYSLKKPVLTWNYPIDSRRHIKYFQVFRRRDIGNIRPSQLPFELVRMYDFNNLQNANNVFYSKNPEESFGFLKKGENNIDNNVIIDVNNQRDLTLSSQTMYIDEEFDNQGYFIYAVACIDAHGISSNYSNQIGIRWNKERNTIDLIDISVPNAPKCYPNLYLEKDAFIDTIKNEGYSQMTVVFNPEYMNVVDNEGLDLQFLSTKPDSKYRIQLINTDLQEDQFFDFTIKDERLF